MSSHRTWTDPIINAFSLKQMKRKAELEVERILDPKVPSCLTGIIRLSLICLHLSIPRRIGAKSCLIIRLLNFSVLQTWAVNTIIIYVGTACSDHVIPSKQFSYIQAQMYSGVRGFEICLHLYKRNTRSAETHHRQQHNQNI